MMIHGGDIYRNHIDYDFSVNINPMGIPKKVLESIQGSMEYCERYPDPESESLKKGIAEFEQVDCSQVLCGNGASELLLAVCHAFKPRNVLIPTPSFYGYQKAAEAVSSSITYYEMRESENFSLTAEFLKYLHNNINMVFLANPNNPTGSGISSELIKEILKECLKKKIVVVIDECFLDLSDFADSYSMKKELLNYSNLIIIRAFTKNFSIPGIRIGYLLTGNPEYIRKIEMHLPEWNISCFAQAAGCAAVLERDFLNKSREYIMNERNYMLDQYRAFPVKLFPSHCNFLLLKSSEPLYEKLLEMGILIRDCSNFRGLSKEFYRIAIRKRSENIILIKALGQIFS